MWFSNWIGKTNLSWQFLALKLKKGDEYLVLALCECSIIVTFFLFLNTYTNVCFLKVDVRLSIMHPPLNVIWWDFAGPLPPFWAHVIYSKSATF